MKVSLFDTIGKIDVQRITERVFESCPVDWATDTVVANLEPGSRDRIKALVKRAIATGELIHVRRGLYCLAPKYQKKGVNPYVLAELIYGPSYISLESALSHHGWIPEAVYTVTSVCSKVSKDFSTPVGVFSYVRVPQRELYTGVERFENGSGGYYFMARPIKALADYVYAHKKNWGSIQPAIESLRIEPEDLAKVNKTELDELRDNYKSKRILRFIDGLKRDLGYER